MFGKEEGRVFLHFSIEYDHHAGFAEKIEVIRKTPKLVRIGFGKDQVGLVGSGTGEGFQNGRCSLYPVISNGLVQFPDITCHSMFLYEFLIDICRAVKFIAFLIINFGRPGRVGTTPSGIHDQPGVDCPRIQPR
mgnify:CR=1 FL=1